MTRQTHQSDPRVLDLRTLARDHQCLAALLRPGLAVLDAGCGTGAITVGIADAVAPEGIVAAVDRDESLLALAGRNQVSGIHYVRADAALLPFNASFDVVNAARTLQWIGDPGAAVNALARAAKPGGRVVALDYNHAENSWQPAPPEPFVRFYDAFLAWRAANGWDNRMADHLPVLFRAAGLVDISVSTQHEIAGRGDPATGIWLHVIGSIGPRIIAAGHLTQREHAAAEAVYGDWIRSGLERQELSLHCVLGTRPRD